MEPARQQQTAWTGAWSAVPDAVAPIRRAVVGYAETLGATARSTEAIALAVSEAATNAVLHAYVGIARGQITVTAERLEPDDLLVLVADDGRGMTPRPDSPGMGLGLPLIAQVAKSVQVSHGARGGTVIQMRFALTG